MDELVLTGETSRGGVEKRARARGESDRAGDLGEREGAKIPLNLQLRTLEPGCRAREPERRARPRAAGVGQP